MENRLEILEHVGRLLDSEQFVGSRSVAKLLTFCVDSALAGNEENLKETMIGIFCFGRSPGYYTKLDPIVRVTARRLRKKLELFYEKEGEHHEFRILLPKGTYVPRFNRCSNRPSTVVPTPDENPIVPNKILAAETASFSLEKIPDIAPHVSLIGRSWLQPAVWSFLVFLLVASFGLYLTHMDSLEGSKPMTLQKHPSHVASSLANLATRAFGVSGKTAGPQKMFSEDQATSGTEDTVSVEPRL